MILIRAHRTIAPWKPRLVFLCGLVPRPAKSLLDVEDGEPELFVAGFQANLLRDELGRSYWPDADAAIAWQRLGVAPLEVARGHSPMLARPGELAELLTR